MTGRGYAPGTWHARTMRLDHGHYFGEPLRRGTAGALTLIETHDVRGLVAARHTHERSCMYIVLDGGFAETYGRAPDSHRLRDVRTSKPR